MHFKGKPAFKASFAACLSLLCLLLSVSSGTAADLGACRKLLLKGNYPECIHTARQAIADSSWDDEWPLLLAKAQIAVGKYPEAEQTITNALERYRSSIPLRLLAYDIFKANAQPERANQVLDGLKLIVVSRSRNYREVPNLVALGKAWLLLKAEPKLVLENFFDEAKRLDPNNREASLAAGELALNKHDYEMAAKVFNDALKKFPDDPDAGFGLACAYAPSDPAKMGESLSTVLDYNTNHVPSMLLLADHLVDAEEYAEAEKLLARALTVNPWEPEAWAYRAVLAHLRNDAGAEASARQNALKYWRANPLVDYLIGKKLSQNYRFLEGSEYQRRALKFDADFLPARIQLSQDLLRLGNESEGWRLADEVHEADGYDVTAYNLTGLRATLSKFQTITNQDFILRMSAKEAAIYGDRALALLEDAKDRLGKKYGLQLDHPTVVEIFAEQKDFGVRTFGMPHNPGFLGVCFGRVVTANGPAAQADHPQNWEAVLWHEFCHVITLGLTHNKMPRWLSEGISVYEERQQNPSWGQSMNPRYREMILGEDLTPVGELSSAFLSPKSALHVQFAYFESSLVVEYLVQTFGLESLKQILADLGNGVAINDAIAKHTAPMDKIEKDFTAFARQRADELAPALDWTKPSQSVRGPTPATTNYWELMLQAKTALAAKNWAEAKPPLKKLLDAYPTQTGPDSAYIMLASVHRELKEADSERAVLTKFTALDDDATDADLRLMELDEAANNWEGVADNAERFLAVNPLVPQPWRYLARASEQLHRNEPAVEAYRRLLLLDPPDPAEVHFHLARLLHQKGDESAAKRHVLQALEEAPRFRDAQRLLLEIENADSAGTHASASPPAAAGIR
ncbi:MAG: hypothetical protein JWR26_3718 [Pedosphaera sp.]|nr:hypothetical protein [Pedosphaera sp.]